MLDMSKKRKKISDQENFQKIQKSHRNKNEFNKDCINTKDLSHRFGMVHKELIDEIDNREFDDFGKLKKQGSYYILNTKHYIYALMILRQKHPKAQIEYQNFCSSMLDQKHYILEHIIHANIQEMERLDKLSEQELINEILLGILGILS